MMFRTWFKVKDLVSWNLHSATGKFLKINYSHSYNIRHPCSLRSCKYKTCFRFLKQFQVFFLVLGYIPANEGSIIQIAQVELHWVICKLPKGNMWSTWRRSWQVRFLVGRSCHIGGHHTMSKSFRTTTSIQRWLLGARQNRAPYP